MKKFFAGANRPYLANRPLSWTALFVVLLLLTFTLAACGGDDEEAAGSSDSAAADSSGSASGPVKFLYFTTADCGATCERMTPIVDGVEKDFAGKLTVERIDASGDAGKKQMEELGLKKTPSYAIIAASGEKLWGLDGEIHKDMLRQQVIGITGQ